jgi:DNA-binding response OmpR family regulator
VQAGTDDFLTKPANKIELLCRIRSLLRVRHLKSQLERTLAYLAEVETAGRAMP